MYRGESEAIGKPLLNRHFYVSLSFFSVYQGAYPMANVLQAPAVLVQLGRNKAIHQLVQVVRMINN
jgi:hypothetical protein